MLKRFLFVALLALASVAQAAVFSLPWGPRPQFVDANGAPMSSGTVTFYVAGSTTPQNTYTDSTGGVANANPITLNTRGETPNEVWLMGGVTYKLVLKDSSGSTVWTVDNISGINDVAAAQAGNEWVAGPAPTYVSATSFTLAGDQTATFTVGRRVKTTNGGGTVYSTITAASFGANITTLTVTNDSGVLDAGLSAVSYGLLSSTNDSVPGAKLTTGAWTFQSPSSFLSTVTLSSGINTSQSSVASATTPDIWTNTGNQIIISGSTTITGFANAPQAGADRKLVFSGSPAITASANMLISGVASGSNYTASPDDLIFVRALSTTQFLLVPVKYSGMPVAASGATTYLVGNVNLNNTANYFNGPNTGSIGANGQTWVIIGVVQMSDSAGAANLLYRIWNGSAAVAENSTQNYTASGAAAGSVIATVTLTGPTTFTLQAKDATSTNGILIASPGGASISNTTTSITAIRIQ